MRADPVDGRHLDDFAAVCVDLTRAIDKRNVWAVANGARHNYVF